MDEYDDWLSRAQTGEADSVVGEIAAELDEHAHDPAWLTRAHYLTAIAHIVAGRPAEATSAASTALHHARLADSPGLTALALSSLANLVTRSQGLARGLVLYQQAERLLSRTGPKELAQPDWVAALIDMWVTAADMGLWMRAVELGQMCYSLPPDATTPFERFAIAQNRAEDTLWDALRPARRPPYEPDTERLELARAQARKAAAAGPTPTPLDVTPKMWDAMVAAWSGDPQAALVPLDELLADPALAQVNTLEPALRAARLRALRRTGDTERLAEVCAAEAVNATALAERLGPSEPVMVFLWESARCSTPELADPGTHAGRLAVFWDREASERERVVNSLLEVYLAKEELEVRHDALADMTRLDELTAVLNRRGLQPHLAEAAADATGTAWALVLVDIDGFKDSNDALGHVAADGLLQVLAGALLRASRADDLVARIGGDEFVVLAGLSDDSRALAVSLGERVLSSIHRADQTGRLRVSVGVASRVEPIEPTAWLQRADAAMYEAKRAGGDRVRVAAGPA